MNLNWTNLELFHEVCQQGGRSLAAAKGSKNVGPSTISRRLKELEKAYGLTLYRCRPFQPTPAGEDFSDFYARSKAEFESLIRKWRQQGLDPIRFGASPIIVKDYLPSLHRQLLQTCPGIQLDFQEGLPREIHARLKAKTLEVAVTLLDEKPPPGYQSEPLLQILLTLLVPSASPLKSVNELWRQKQIKEVLICPTSDEAIVRHFRLGCERLGIEWRIGLEASSISVVEAYVRDGFGLGLSLAIPGWELDPGVRALILRGFPPMTVVVIWPSRPSATIQALVDVVRRAAEKYRESMML